MKPGAHLKVESQAAGDFARVMQANRAASPDGNGDAPAPTRLPARIDLDPDKVKNGLGQLVLTLVKLLHELLERQGIRRIEAGSLTDDQIERLGLTLMKQSQEIDRLRQEFGLEEEDLNIDLGPLGQLF